MRRQATPAAADAPVPIMTAPRLAPTEATRRWAALLQQIYEVDSLACPHCAGPMRIVACITQSAVIDHILTHLRTRAASGARPPSTVSPVARGAHRRPTASTAPRSAPLRSLNVAPRAPAYWSGPFGARSGRVAVPHRSGATGRKASREGYPPHR